MKRLWLFCLVFLFHVAVQAQDTSTQPSLPSFPPENIRGFFSDAVEILSIESINEPLPPPANVAYLELESWNFVLEDLRRIRLPEEWSGNAIRYDQKVQDWYFFVIGEAPASSLWRYDSLTNDFEQAIQEGNLAYFDTLCGLQSSISIYSLDWVWLEEAGEIHLCQLFTGRQTLALASGYQYRELQFNSSQLRPQLSPNERWLAFAGAPNNDELYLFVYDLVDERVQNLGWVHWQAEMSISWLSEDIVTVFGRQRNGPGYATYAHSYDLFNLSEGTELHLTPFGNDYWPAEGFTQVDTEELRIVRYFPDTENCVYEVYELEDFSSQRYDYGQLCYFAKGDLFGDGYHIGLDGYLYSYNPMTGVQATIFDDALVSELIWIDEEQGLANLIIDNDSFGRYVSPWEGARSDDGNGDLILLDLQTGEILHRAETYYNGWAGYWERSTLRPYNDEWWILPGPCCGAREFELIRLGGNEPESRTITGSMLYFSDQWGIVVESTSVETPRLQQASLYHLESAETLLLVDLSSLQYPYTSRLSRDEEIAGRYILSIGYDEYDSIRQEIIITFEIHAPD